MDELPGTHQERPPAWQILSAFAVIYLVWGSTFLAIRVGVREIPPFLMIPFVENAFKHGTNGENSSVITIIANATRDQLKMEISNTIVPTRTDRETGVGLGIETTRQRLELLYPGKHTLTVTNDSGLFTVSLQILFR